MTAAAVAAQAIAWESDASSEGREAIRRCPLRHPLRASCTDMDGYSCSMCEHTFSRGTLLYSCRPCDFDVCEACSSKKIAPNDHDESKPCRSACASDRSSRQGEGESLYSEPTDCSSAPDNVGFSACLAVERPTGMAAHAEFAGDGRGLVHVAEADALTSIVEEEVHRAMTDEPPAVVPPSKDTAFFSEALDGAREPRTAAPRFSPRLASVLDRVAAAAASVAAAAAPAAEGLSSVMDRVAPNVLERTCSGREAPPWLDAPRAPEPREASPREVACREISTQTAPALPPPECLDFSAPGPVPSAPAWPAQWRQALPAWPLAPRYVGDRRIRPVPPVWPTGAPPEGPRRSPHRRSRHASRRRPREPLSARSAPEEAPLSARTEEGRPLSARSLGVEQPVVRAPPWGGGPARMSPRSPGEGRAQPEGREPSQGRREAAASARLREAPNAQRQVPWAFGRSSKT